MRLQFVRMSRDRLDHERIWAAVGLALGVMGLVFPLEGVRVRCPFKVLTGWPCATCGMTRSFIHLRQFDLVGALAANPLIAVLALFAVAYCIYAWIAVLFRTRRIRISVTRRWEPTVIRVLVVAAVLGNWLYLIWMGR